MFVHARRHADCLAVLLLVVAAGARTLHVGVHGDDGNSGLDSANALRTIEQAASACLDRDTILIYPGTYVEREGALFERDNLVIRGADPGSTPTITCDNRRSVSIRGDNATVENLSIYRSAYGLLLREAHNFTVRNCTISSSYQTGLRVRDVKGGLVEGCEITDCGLVHFPHDNGNNWPHAVLGMDADNITIRNCRIFRNHGEGVGPYLNCGNWKIQDNEVYDNWAINIYIDTPRDTCLVERNLCYYTGWADSTSMDSDKPVGIRIAAEGDHEPNVYNYEIRNNIIVNCGSGIEVLGYGAGIVVHESRIVHNTIVDVAEENPRWGIRVSSGRTGDSFVIANNLLCGTAKMRLEDDWAISKRNLFIAEEAFVGGPRWEASSYRLLGASPAVDTAVVLNDLDSDYFQTPRPRGAFPDAGAVEWHLASATRFGQRGRASIPTGRSRKEGIAAFTTPIDLLGRRCPQRHPAQGSAGRRMRLDFSRGPLLTLPMRSR